jgi:tetratricopeptide (TPR) repeat protein
VNTLSRHCVETIAAALLLSLLAACSSTGGSGLEDGEAQVDIVEDAAPDAAAAQPEENLADAGTEAAASIDLTIEPNLDEISERVQRSYDMAIAAMHADDWLTAELELEQLILEEPGFPGPYVNLALIYKLDGRLGEARTALEQAIAIAQEFAPANNELGVMLREAGDFDGAQAAYERALAGDPGNAIAHLNLGILLDLYLQRPSDALDHYKQYQATRDEPDEQVARWIVDLERRTRAAERVAKD